MLLLHISRVTLQEMNERERCEFTDWISTTNKLCSRCIRIFSVKLCIDNITDRNYLKYINATSSERVRLREKCVLLYLALFEQYAAELLFPNN